MSAPSSHASRSATGLRLALGLLGLVLAWAIFDARPPRPDDPARAADLIRRVALPSDLILIDDPAMRIDLAPFAGLPVLATRTVPIEADAFERLLVLSAGADSGLVRALQHRTHTRALLTVGDWTVHVLEPTAGHRVIFDVGASLARARVELVRDDERYPCPWKGDAFHCGSAEWQHIRPITQMLQGQPHRCIWTHPIEDAAIELHLPPVAGATALAGWYGMSDYAVSVSPRGRVVLEAESGSTSRRFRLYGQRGRRPVRMELPRGATEGVTLRFTTSEQGVRHLCWHLQLVASLEGA